MKTGGIPPSSLFTLIPHIYIGFSFFKVNYSIYILSSQIKKQDKRVPGRL